MNELGELMYCAWPELVTLHYLLRRCQEWTLKVPTTNKN